ncbi:hypothetical protein SBOR_3360 [Sclerotinia borealis F-4128]|uniref:Carboxylesterase type B domain-containing protein n=1 Tax=Sclerotinia borealis (strain F-4128) TaxID=1432307 RepID=W9CPB4_SCLBF|nr:hypothetical protein SBOR_3360 [Sclerotinia borealis F-4128]
MLTSLRVSIPSKGYLLGPAIIDKATNISKCYRFLKVPYALPPIGERRWQKPFPLPLKFSYGSEDDPPIYNIPSFPCPQTSQFIDIGPSTEDCLHSNIYVPLGIPPLSGWPVFFYIRSNNSDDPSSLLAETDFKCIIVCPAYRLGVLGFLAGRELWDDTSAGNLGFWDQRAALEWTYDNIESFGGNKENITVGGLSAGSYSTFYQLAYDIGRDSRRQIIRRVIQWSNGCGVEPKQISEAQEQFDDLLSVLGIPQSLSGKEKVEVLRTKSSDELISAVGKMKQVFIRPFLDGKFISKDLFPSIYDGSFGKRMKELGIRTIIGDLTQEFQVYKNVFPPSSHETLVNRLSWDYPQSIVKVICEKYKPDHASPNPPATYWIDIFGKLYADLQVHSTMRGFLESISSHVPLHNIHRCKIDWRTESVDKRYPKEFGATHGTDMSIWFFGNGDSLTEREKELLKEWLKPMIAFINGEDVDWGTRSIKDVRILTSDGKIEIREDEIYEEKLELWKLVKMATKFRGEKFEHKIEVLKYAEQDSSSKSLAETKKTQDPRELIAHVAAQEFSSGMNCNLGVGIPTMTAGFAASMGIHVFLQSENGMTGCGPYPGKGKEDSDWINAGKESVTPLPGASKFGSDESFGQIRGGHMDMTVLGALECSQYGDVANYMIPGKMVKGMGGAMDLVSNPQKTKVMVVQTHVDKYVTDLAVFDVNHEKGLTLRKYNPNVSIDEIKEETDCEFRTGKDCKAWVL